MNNSIRGRYPGDLLSLDLVGPMRHCLASRHVYLLTITDSFSHMLARWQAAKRLPGGGQPGSQVEAI